MLANLRETTTPVERLDNSIHLHSARYGCFLALVMNVPTSHLRVLGRC